MGKVLHGKVSRGWASPGFWKEKNLNLIRDWVVDLDMPDTRLSICSSNVKDPAFEVAIQNNVRESMAYKAIMKTGLDNFMFHIDVIKKSEYSLRALMWFLLCMNGMVLTVSLFAGFTLFGIGYLIVLSMVLIVSSWAGACKIIKESKKAEIMLLKSLESIEKKCAIEMESFNDFCIQQDIKKLKSAVFYMPDVTLQRKPMVAL